MKPEVRIKLELWDNYIDYVDSLPWWRRWVIKRRHADRARAKGLYDPARGTIVIFMSVLFIGLTVALKRQGVPIEEEPTAYRVNFYLNMATTLIHEMIHASGIEKKQGSHIIDGRKLKKLPIWMRALVEDYLLFIPEDFKYNGTPKSIFDSKRLI